MAKKVVTPAPAPGPSGKKIDRPGESRFEVLDWPYAGLAHRGLVYLRSDLQSWDVYCATTRTSLRGSPGLDRCRADLALTDER